MARPLEIEWMFAQFVSKHRNLSGERRGAWRGYTLDFQDETLIGTLCRDRRQQFIYEKITQ
jgi:hypothetical protein